MDIKIAYNKKFKGLPSWSLHIIDFYSTVVKLVLR